MSLAETWISFFCVMPSNKDPLQGHFKMVYRPIRPRILGKAYVHHFEMPTNLGYARAS
jgi:hypothetical protein